MVQQIMDEPCLSQVKISQRLHKSRFSQLFHVEALGKECVLKIVSRSNTPVAPHIRTNQYNSHARRDDYVYESELFSWESAAYRRAKEAGICAKGLVPGFYRTVTAIMARAREL